MFYLWIVRKYQNIIVSFLLLLFVAAQASIIHEFSHQDDAQDCEICLVAHDFQSISYDIAPAIDAPYQVSPPIKKEIAIDIAFAKAESQPTIHTTRPPPLS
ncbi:hypothetical protein LX97_01663 [Nonlabens dokdonensis]|jgi:hypothetical protein|uniref:Uncharacterized protein n=2 Tax=Nonlabens dokdonensis TaxID=328515 RepID=L7WB96_NONDD|nr:hypothetical protein [Nonlabens dokdonensis]AGC77364.1 hypothetical protein DDD_2237 [Nonlabens dokdonensis DSW-6]PZX40890.1 hypothetical protein LX97_01663 [Nonlabens dokdonensis]